MRAYRTLNLVALTLTAIAEAAEDCVPFDGSSLNPAFPDEDYVPLCLKPQLTKKSSLKLDSLFPDGVDFVYAIQTYDEEEILDLATDEQIIGTPDDLNNAAYWLEYSKTDFKKSSEKITELGVSFVNGLDGSTEDDNGGCEGVLGKDCVDDLTKLLKDYLFESTHPTGRRPTTRVNLNYAWLRLSDKDMSRCPEMLSDAVFPGSIRIAVETESDEANVEAYILPSGNSSWAYATAEHENTLEYEKNYTAIAIAIQSPFVEALESGGFDKVPEEDFFNGDDINVQFACVKHSNTKKSEDKDDGGATGDSSSGDGDESSDDAEDEDDFALKKFQPSRSALILCFGVIVIANWL